MGRKRKGFAIFTLRRTNDKNLIGRIYMCRLIYSQSCKYRWAHTTAKQELFHAITCPKYTAKGKIEKSQHTDVEICPRPAAKKIWPHAHSHIHNHTVLVDSKEEKKSQLKIRFTSPKITTRPYSLLQSRLRNSLLVLTARH